ncbi:ComEC/Rec2 family competence protein [Candidatus Microgenomates bacterium]|nr:MAG: ComEC/Rec2 family competence protein [Candidatus Microgenomates bacterium]
MFTRETKTYLVSINFFKWALFVFLLAAVAVRVHVSTPRLVEGQKYLLRGAVSSEPVHYETQSRIVINGVRAYVPRYPEVSIGDYLEVKGEYARFALRKAVVEKHIKSQSFLYTLRSRVLGIFENNLPRDDAALVSGVVLGSQKGISEEFNLVLRKAGVVHVVVASGTNVVFVSAFCMGVFLLFFKRRSALVLSIASIWLYVLLSGFSPPLVRAALMGSVAAFAVVSGKISTGIRNLFFACVAMLLVKPVWAADLGFVMSVLASLGLILFESKINSKLLFVPKIVRQDLSTTLAAQVGVLPVLIGVFGNFNVLSPVVNVLVLWTIPPIMIIGSLSAVLGLVFEPLGGIFLFLVYPLTQWFISLARLFGA